MASQRKRSSKTSKPTGKLAVDANAMMSAIIGGKAMRVFHELAGVEFVTTRFTIDEVEGYMPALATKMHTTVEKLQTLLGSIPVTVFTDEAYQHRLAEARRLMKDPKDVDLLALTLEFQSAVWSKDSDFNDSGVQRYTTGVLLNFLEPPQPQLQPPQPPAPSP